MKGLSSGVLHDIYSTDFHEYSFLAVGMGFSALAAISAGALEIISLQRWNDG